MLQLRSRAIKKCREVSFISSRIFVIMISYAASLLTAVTLTSIAYSHFSEKNRQ